MNSSNQLKEGLIHGFIDRTNIALEEYKPKLIINDPDRGEKVLTSIINELRTCDEFFFSVAFVTTSGVTVLLNTLLDLEERGIKGKILASQYQNFSEPKALEKLLSMKNIELKIVTEDVAKMHTKGYVFRNQEEYSIIVGSSNLTQYALCENKEWNLKVSSSKNGALVESTIREFNYMFDHATEVNSDWLQEYKAIYDFERATRHEAKKIMTRSDPGKVLKLQRISPNQMQVTALGKLEDTRNNKKRKALIISATGTGKTYLSAFDVQKFNPGRFLFVVHREQIAKAALESFQRVIGHEKTMSVLSGNNKDLNSDYLFSTIQTISKEDVYRKFKTDEFDYIVIDEVHRAGADSYQKIINYFKPEFLMGMSATPERTDGFDIYDLFDHNVPFEIRLNYAMKEGMICPFHYFGVSELTIEGQLIDDKTTFNNLTSDKRVQYIKEKVEFYGYSGDRVKGLVFCSRNEEAKILSDKFNELGYRTRALSGADSQEDRIQAVNQLGQTEREGALDYIFTVDIFNEGIDIPEVNQVVMLRPTKSAIIFVQQLGRGLRKMIDKEFVVVLDFIGNYDNNYLIPIALSDDHSYNKDNIRRYIAEGNRIIYGCSTINFDKVTRERIYKSIDRANFNDLKIIRESYLTLKQRLGRIPKLKEFRDNGAIDIERITAKTKSYHNFLKKYEKDYELIFSEIQEEFIEYIAQKYVNGKRPHELELIRITMNDKKDVLSVLEKRMQEKYEIRLNENTKINLINQMIQGFATGSARNSYKDAIFIEKSFESYNISGVFENCLIDPLFVEVINEMIDIGLEINSEQYCKRYNGTNFVLYEKYTYEDICKLLDWSKSEVALNIGGYKLDKATKTFPVFVNYNKSDEISHSIQYHDRFITPSDFIAVSKSKRNINSDDVKQFYSADQDGVEISLFVRKDKEDKISKEFYYLGPIHTNGKPNQFIMANTTLSAVEIQYRLEVPVREDLYDYLITD